MENLHHYCTIIVYHIRLCWSLHFCLPVLKWLSREAWSQQLEQECYGMGTWTCPNKILKIKHIIWCDPICCLAADDHPWPRHMYCTRFGKSVLCTSALTMELCFSVYLFTAFRHCTISLWNSDKTGPRLVPTSLWRAYTQPICTL